MWNRYALLMIILSTRFLSSCTDHTTNHVDDCDYDFVPETVLIYKYLSFTMGCYDKPLWNNYIDKTERPAFKVILTPYWIGKYEVRNDEFAYFVNDNGYSDSTLWSSEGWKYIKSENRARPAEWIEGKMPWINCIDSNTPDKPIYNICWYEAEAYCNWLSKQTGEKYSLPTEAQWERAARGPDPGRIFPWGNIDDKSKYNVVTISQKLFPVGSFESGRSYDGCYDMSGNVMEFCKDKYELYIYKKYKEQEPVDNPAGPETSINDRRSIKGGRCHFHNDRDIENSVTTFKRDPCDPVYRSILFGFRIAKNIK